MTRSRQNSLIAFILLVCAALVLGACGSDDGGAQDNNGFDLRTDVGGEDGSSDAGDGEDGGGADGGGADIGGADIGGTDTSGEDTGTDPTTPFTAEGLSSGSWYGITLLSAEPATTGSMLPIEFHEDMTVTMGFRGETTGEFAFFGDERVRLFNLMNGDEPNQPEQFLLDADVEDDQVEGLEIVIPDSEGGEPYVLRFEQQSTPDIASENIAGNWQSDETYTGENGGSFRLAIRILAGTFGYGGYNGAYIEFISGDLEMITYDTGETFWFNVPPAGGNPVPSLAGEVRVGPQGDYLLWAPREVTPQSGEFESVEMFQVDSFTNP
jgi:hypothetical protein